MGEHTYQHLVPQTYLSAWSSNGTSVRQLDKLTDKIKPARIDNNFGINHEYSVCPGTLGLSKEQCAELFLPLDGYTMKYEDKILDSAERLNNMFPFYDDWEMYDTDGKLVGRKRKCTLKQQLLKGRDLSLEIKQIKSYEDKWPKMRDELVRRVMCSSNNSIDEFCRGFFIRYMVLQHWRGFGHSASENRAFDAVNSIFPLSNIEIPETQRIYKAGSNFDEEMRHDMRLKDFKQYFESSGPIYTQTEWLLKNATLEIYVAPSPYHFLSSDTPCYAYKDTTVQFLFPITPQVLITLKNPVQKDLYQIFKLSKSKVQKINTLTITAAKQFVIAYDDNDF